MIELIVGLIILGILNKTHPKVGNDIIIPLPDWDKNNNLIGHEGENEDGDSSCDY